MPALSPSGALLAYERSEAAGEAAGEAAASGPGVVSRVWIQPRQPGPAAFTLGDPAHSTSQPQWAPGTADETLSVYDRQAQAYLLLSPINDEMQRISNGAGQGADWQPGGRAFITPEIFFLDANLSEELKQQLDRLADSHLLLYSQPDWKAVDLTQAEGIEDTGPAFSPDGAFLAFARKYLDTQRWTPGRQLWLMDLVTRQAFPLTDDPDYNHFDFAWRSDGRLLAYVRFDQSRLTEPPEIWIIDLETREQEQIAAGGYAPQWIP
jgi:dipeptidyl aminopeptidase/acylaminoacyl peptidase